jgi:hypothetical protein
MLALPMIPRAKGNAPTRPSPAGGEAE